MPSHTANQPSLVRSIQPRALLLVGFIAAIGTSACAKDDPLFCTAQEMCLEGHQYCDVEGICPASGYHGNTCIPEACWDAGPLEVDAGVADAGMSPDADVSLPAVLNISPGGRSFGSVVLGNQSGSATFVVTNDGESTSGTLSVTVAGSAAGDFEIDTDSCTGQTLSAGSTCDIDVLFGPSTAGARLATLDVEATPGGSISADLDGVALAPGDLVMSPTNHNFNTVSVGANSGSTNLTVTNEGGSPTGTLSTNLDDAANFDIVSDTCDGVSLGAGGMCTIGTRASPTARSCRRRQASIAARTAARRIRRPRW